MFHCLSNVIETKKKRRIFSHLTRVTVGGEGRPRWKVVTLSFFFLTLPLQTKQFVEKLGIHPVCEMQIFEYFENRTKPQVYQISDFAFFMVDHGISDLYFIKLIKKYNFYYYHQFMDSVPSPFVNVYKLNIKMIKYSFWSGFPNKPIMFFKVIKGKK